MSDKTHRSVVYSTSEGNHTYHYADDEGGPCCNTANFAESELSDPVVTTEESIGKGRRLCTKCSTWGDDETMEEICDSISEITGLDLETNVGGFRKDGLLKLREYLHSGK